MHLSDILSEKACHAQTLVASKKRALEVISEIGAKQANDLDQSAIYQNLLKRERLGTTAIGHGIAIPHCRIEGLNTPLAILLQLKKSIDFGAIDGEPVDIIAALLVPQESTDEHLKLLAELAELFNKQEIREQIRHSQNDHQLYEMVTSWNKANES